MQRTRPQSLAGWHKGPTSITSIRPIDTDSTPHSSTGERHAPGQGRRGTVSVAGLYSRLTWSHDVNPEEQSMTLKNNIERTFAVISIVPARVRSGLLDAILRSLLDFLHVFPVFIYAEYVRPSCKVSVVTWRGWRHVIGRVRVRMPGAYRRVRQTDERVQAGAGLLLTRRLLNGRRWEGVIIGHHATWSSSTSCWNRSSILFRSHRRELILKLVCRTWSIDNCRYRTVYA